MEGDLFEPFPKNRKGRGKRQFDYILSNPPYIPTGVIPGLMREVRDYEPMIALDGGLDGLDYYRRILKEAHLYLAKDGVLIMEIGHDQGGKLSSLAEEVGVYAPMEVFEDFSEKNRLAILRWRENDI